MRWCKRAGGRRRRAGRPPRGCGAPPAAAVWPAHRGCPRPQIVVLDKLDYCATENNLKEIWNNLNFKVGGRRAGAGGRGGIAGRGRFAPAPRAPPCRETMPPPRPPCARNPQFIKGDLQSADLLSYVLATEQIDTVMHFAAQTHVDNSFGNSLAFTMNNTWVVLGGLEGGGRSEAVVGLAMYCRWV